MALDLAQFHEAFFEEGFEALDAMETALLELEAGAPDAEIINTVFRVAHSIKGGSATFGFEAIASFTHTLETVLDALRSGRMQVTGSLSNLLLKSVDVMKLMLRATQRHEPVDAQTVADLQFDLEVAMANPPDGPPANLPASAKPIPADIVPPERTPPPRVAPSGGADAGRSPLAPVTSATAAATARGPGWRIAFRPLPQLLRHGNDPLRMFAGLAELGTLEAHADLSALPAFADLDPERCFLAWQIDLHTEAGREVVEEVFDWAEGECTLAISRLEAPADPVALDPATPKPERAANGGPAEYCQHVDRSRRKTGPPSLAHTGHAPGQPVPAPAPAPTPAPTPGAQAGSIRVQVGKIDELMNTVGELVITKSMLTQLAAKLEGGAADRLRAGLAQLERNLRELQESVMRVRMLPISVLFSRFPRMVHDLSQRLGKQIELDLSGEHTELDKTVLEKIGDPLMHLVRNCVDHGVELPEERRANGKPVVGRVYLNAFHRGGSIVVEVGDDGRGLATQRILAKARARGLLAPGATPGDAEIHELIFLPGFSTVERTTELSGRGVGMDVVRRNILELGGSVSIHSVPLQGSRFTITLPLTLAIVDAQLIAVGEDIYIVPLVSIIESLQLEAGMVNRLPGRGEVFRFRDSWLPALRLHELFGVRPHAARRNEGLVMVVEGDGRRVGIFVDELLDQQPVVVKSLETNYGRIPGVSGATILGAGSVALILDVPGLIRMATARAVA